MAHEHDGHRDRMRERFLNTGLSSFAPHEVLEIMLYYCIPRKNTNDIAHRLLNKFGSIPEVCCADIEQLMSVEGVSKNAAVFLKLIPGIVKRFISDTAALPNAFDEVESFRKYVWSLFIDKKNECLFVISLDAKGQILCADMVCDGEISEACFSARKIVETVIKSNASQVVIAHNHPSGILKPSDSDLRTTIELKNLLKSVNIDLIDHFIVTKSSVNSLADAGVIK